MGNHVRDEPTLKTANIGVCLTDNTDMRTDMAKNKRILFKSNFLFLLWGCYLVGAMMEGKRAL